MNDAFYFILKALFILKIFFFFLDFFSCRKTRDKQAKVNFKIYDVSAWETNYCNKHIARYLNK